MKRAEMPHVESRRYFTTERHEMVGRTSEVATCPFCGAKVVVFVWSLAGSGKRCECGALFGSFSRTRETRREGDPDPICGTMTLLDSEPGRGRRFRCGCGREVFSAFGRARRHAMSCELSGRHGED